MESTFLDLSRLEFFNFVHLCLPCLSCHVVVSVVERISPSSKDSLSLSLSLSLLSRRSTRLFIFVFFLCSLSTPPPPSPGQLPHAPFLSRERKKGEIQLKRRRNWEQSNIINLYLEAKVGIMEESLIADLNPDKQKKKNIVEIFGNI